MRLKDREGEGNPRPSRYSRRATRGTQGPGEEFDEERQEATLETEEGFGASLLRAPKIALLLLLFSRATTDLITFYSLADPSSPLPITRRSFLPTEHLSPQPKRNHFLAQFRTDDENEGLFEVF